MRKEDIIAIEDELKFWQRFVKTEYFLNNWVPDNKKTPDLHDEVYQFLLNNKGKVLDVGSGAVSILRGTVHEENLTVVDPLGGLYQFIFNYPGYMIKQPIICPSEELPYDNVFDIVHMSNALDHCQNPRIALYNLVRATKPGGYTIVQGFVNEATFEKFSGFHQFDIDMTPEGELLINKLHTGYIANTFYLKKTLKTGKNWIIWVSRK